MDNKKYTDTFLRHIHDHFDAMVMSYRSVAVRNRDRIWEENYRYAKNALSGILYALSQLKHARPDGTLSGAAKKVRERKVRQSESR